jgi:very-short-patch-repair endonuclease
LWQHLRHKQLGVRVRRQHTIGQFIVDFYVPSAALVIEVDGDIHQYTAEEDAIRTAYLEAHGLRVVRFSNDEVLSDAAKVVEQIQALL